MNLFVANINYDLSKAELETVFAPYGNATADIFYDQKTGRSRGIALIKGLDAASARRAIKEVDGRMIMGRPIAVKQDNRGGVPPPRPVQGGCEQSDGRQRKPGQASGGPGVGSAKGGAVFPYRFVRRTVPERRNRPIDGVLKKGPTAFHDRLDSGRCDVAFEIAWETLTPTALNPCADPDPNIPRTMPENGEGDFSGYNRRWLIIGNRLAISPFTVKSAIAAGYANLLGGCYRVIDKMEGHPAGGVKEGQYHYKGGYKRYRVSMNNRSRPGIIRNIEVMPDGSRAVEIQPVTEYFLDENTAGLSKGGVYFGSTYSDDRGHKHFVTSPRPAKGPKRRGDKELIYHGPYRFGMDLTLKAPDLRKRHRHRFYEEHGKIVSGDIPAVNFESPGSLKKKVYMGEFRHVHGPDPRPEGGFWYEDLNGLAVGDWIYYHSFFDPRKDLEVVTNIGKNFQFKAMFYHPDAVPPDHRPCGRIDMLCPRCRMFGMVETEKAKNRRAVGLRGRFKSATLRDIKVLKEIASKPYRPPEAKGTVHLKQWSDSSGATAAYQALLPISGPPKPNKRDDGGGYFDDRTGEIRGAKVYHHSALKSAENIQQMDANPPRDYTHRLRNYAMVCEPGRIFEGTVGAENCKPMAVAAFLLLLDAGLGGHGFKIGLGKAFGMGGVKSRIRAVWVRNNDDYNKWKKIENVETLTKKDFIDRLDGVINGVRGAVDALVAIDDFNQRMNPFSDMESRHVEYPKPQAKENKGRRKYWDIFKAGL